jgi:hypothetical protein
MRTGLPALILMGAPACYAQLGVGYSAGGPSAELAAGVSAHFDEAGGMRGGAALAIGGGSEDGRSRKVAPGPIVVGGYGRLGGDKNALIVTGDVHVPVISGLVLSDPDQTLKAPASRAYLGVGYQLSLLEKDYESGEEGVGAVVQLSAGPELFWAHSGMFGDDVSLGGSVSVLGELRSLALKNMFKCFLGNSNDGCK